MHIMQRKEWFENGCNLLLSRHTRLTYSSLKIRSWAPKPFIPILLMAAKREREK